MSHKLINHSPDLTKLCNEGYELEIRGGHLLVQHVPYVNARREIKYGTLVSSLTLASERTARPNDHVIRFIGEHPCNCDGTIISAIRLGSGNENLDAARGIIVNHSFSNKPPCGYYNDYYEKVTSYIRVISCQAEAIDPTVTAKTNRVIESTDEESVFNYLDTNSTHAEIVNISAKLEKQKVAIIGLGGTGSYVLDFVAKTPVKEIHLFDKDVFLQHNAFRSPGAASVEQLASQPKKVKYLHEIYSKMRKFIFVHEHHVDASNLDQLAGVSFVFICIDNSPAKKAILEKLIGAGIPFVDVGIGVQTLDGALSGSVRVTTGTPAKNDHIKDRIPFAENGEDAYAQNIQIAELNALNAALAVIKWKKLLGFYHDLEKEANSVYEINVNRLMND